MNTTSFATYTISLLKHAALLGWTPEALRHHLAKTNNLPLLDYCMFLAKSELSDAVPAEVRYHWHVECPFAEKQDAPSTNLHALWEQLRKLPQITSVDLRLAEDPCADDDDLPEEQRKAQRKITALLRKAESTPYEEEAATYIQKAAALQAKYNVAAATVDQPRHVRTKRVLISAPYVREKSLLLCAIARNCGVRVISLTSTGVMCTVGYAADLAYVSDMFASLERQCLYFMENSPRAREARSTGTTTSFRRSFIIAYASEIGDILSSATRDVADAHEASHSALVETTAAVDKTFRDLFPETSTTHIHARNDAGYQEGARSAKSSHFGGDSSGVGGRRSIGA